MTALPLPNARTQFIDADGAPLVGGQVFTYIPGTTTAKTTWQDINQTILNTNPIVLDDLGSAAIWGNGAYRQIVYDVLGNLIWDAVTTNTNDGDGERGRDVWVTDFGAVMDGRNISVPIVQAIAYAVASGSSRVRFPAGEGNTNGGPIVIPNGIKLIGEGRNRTLLNKTDDLGNMFILGTAGGFQSGGIEGMGCFHNYTGIGPGYSLPTSAVQVVYPMTSGSIIYYVNGPYRSGLKDVWATGGLSQITISGGANYWLTDIETAGVYNPAVAALQCSPSGILVQPSPSGDFSTNGIWTGVDSGGTITPAISPGVYPDYTWPGGHVTSNVPTNIGPLKIWDIRAVESHSVVGGYVGSGAKNNLAFTVTQKPDLSFYSLSGFSLVDTFIDAAQEAMVEFYNPNGGNAYTITLRPGEMVGQTNCFTCFRDNDAGNQPLPVLGLIIDAPLRATVGPLGQFQHGRLVNFKGTGTGWNAKGFYTAEDPALGRNCGFWNGPSAQANTYGGQIGGNSAGASDVNTVWGVYRDPASVGISVTAQDTGCAQSVQCGLPLTVGGAYTKIGATTFAVDSNFTLKGAFTTSIVEFTAALNTADRTCTINPGDAPEGHLWLVSRTSAGAFNLIVSGSGSKTLGVNSWVSFRKINGTAHLMQSGNV